MIRYKSWLSLGPQKLEPRVDDRSTCILVLVSGLHLNVPPFQEKRVR